MTSSNAADSASSCNENNGQGKPSRPAVFPVVGVGASAGGLEALTELLTHLPAKSGMAFVLIQHLDPLHESMLSNLMAKATELPVAEAKDQMPVEPDHVYVIPPNTSIAIVDGVLALTPRRREHHMPIDFFFRALATDRKEAAIGVVLSGAGSDGTLGLGAIKAEGGITFAQDEQSAAYTGMPHSAAASGNVDFVLPAAEIARELARIAGHPYLAQPPEEKPEEPITAAAAVPALGAIFARLRTVTGVDFTHYKRTTITRRIHRRMLLHQIDSLADFQKYLKQNMAEVDALYRDFLINVTEFFRDAEVFQALKSEVFPSLLKDRPPDAAIRIWVPGCSSGEELYSLAMVLLEFLGEKSVNPQIQFFGSDLGEDAIEKARAGFYAESAVAVVSPERLRRFFARADGGYRINKAVREMCVFARHNLLADPPFSHMNLISCRNVLIYMDSVLQQQVIPILHYALNPSGFLMLGSSEGIGAFSNLFDAVDKKRRIYLKRWAPEHVDYNFAAKGHPAFALAHVKSSPAQEDALALQTEFDRVLLANYAPAAVVVRDDLEVLQSRGDTSPYLKLAAGKASLNLLKMAREGLGFELRNAIVLAKKQKMPIRKDGIKVKSGGATQSVSIEVTPLKLAFTKESCLVIVFDGGASAPPAKAVEKPETSRTIKQGKQPSSDASRILQLEQELASTKEDLQSIVERHDTSNEELQAANEEILSANEELQSTNEELETAKEELQSANEELLTLNDELRNRNTELTQVNNDLVNLLTTVNIPVIMVDCDLRIRRLTAMAEKVLRVIPADVGRLITDIKLNIDVPDLEKLILSVVENLHPVEQEVRDGQGRWYSLHLRPYRTADNKIDGAVLALHDIDLLKHSEQAFKKSADFARSIIDTVREPLLVLDWNLRVTMANQSFYTVFQVSPEETLSRLLYELGNAEWNIPRLRTLMGEILPKSQAVCDFVVEHDFLRIGRKTMLLNAREIRTVDPDNPLILLGIEDITERKRAEEEALLAAEKLASAGRIAATIAHEINNPLDALGNVIYMLGQQSVLDETSRNLVKLGEEQAKLITSITRQTLGLFSSSSQVQSVAISPVLDETLELLADKFRIQSISLDKRYDIEGILQAAPTELRQVFTNLLVNALAATPAGGKIAVHVFASRDWGRPERRGVCVVIADTGSGISPDHQKKIFEPFFTTKGEQGTGLGLYVIRGIVEKYEGTIRLRSSTRSGKSGACFSIFFPAGAGENPDAASTNAPSN